MSDVKTLEMLAERIDKDAKRFSGLSPIAMRSIAEIIRTAIGAPLSWPSRCEGAIFADQTYPGSPDLRLAFNHGVKWAIEQYGQQNLAAVEYRFGKPETISGHD